MLFDVVHAIPVPVAAPEALIEALLQEIQSRGGRVLARTGSSLEFRSSFLRGRSFLTPTLNGISYGRLCVEPRDDGPVIHYRLSLAGARYFVGAFTIIGCVGALYQGLDKQTMLSLFLGIVFGWGFIYGGTWLLASLGFRRLVQQTAASIS
jgi:hypothetical protein